MWNDLYLHKDMRYDMSLLLRNMCVSIFSQMDKNARKLRNQDINPCIAVGLLIIYILNCVKLLLAGLCSVVTTASNFFFFQEGDASQKCLSAYNYDKSMCSAYFQRYKNCRKYWVSDFYIWKMMRVRWRERHTDYHWDLRFDVHAHLFVGSMTSSIPDAGVVTPTGCLWTVTKSLCLMLGE